MRLGAAVFVVSFAAAAMPVVATAQTPVPVQWSIAPLPANTATSAKPIDATLTAVIEEGWKVYSLTQAPGGPVALVITVPKEQRFSTAGPAAGPLPHVAFDPNFNFDTEYYEGKPTFKVPVRLAAGADARTETLRVVVVYQTCNQRLCLPPTEVELTTGTTGDDGSRQATTGSRNALTQPSSSVGGSLAAPVVTSRDPSLPVVTSRHPSSPVVTSRYLKIVCSRSEPVEMIDAPTPLVSSRRRMYFRAASGSLL